MAALTTPRITPQKLDGQFGNTLGPVGVKASTTLYTGGVVCTTNAGYAVPGSTGASLICQGVLGDQAALSPGGSGSVVNNGADGAVIIEIQTGTFFLDNDVSNPVTQADIGHACFLLDDHTVSHLAAGSAARCVAGTVVGVNATGTSEPVGIGVWVKLGTVQPFQATGMPYG